MSPLATVKVSVEVKAPPDEVFAVLADPSRHADFDGSGTVIDCAERPDQPALGEFFVMRMELNGLPYRSRDEIVELEPERAIAWRTMPCRRILGLFFGGQTWRFGLAPAGEVARSPVPGILRNSSVRR